MPTSPVSAERALKEVILAQNDPAEFIDRFVWIKDETTGKVVRFNLWDYQRDLLREWRTYRLNVDLKARQLGISWLMCAYALWLVNFYDNITILCFSQTQEKAFELINKIRFMYSHLPSHLQKPVVKDNAGQFVFKADGPNAKAEGSRIIGLPATPGAGVSYTATLILNDEWGEQTYAEELYGSYKPTIDMGGALIGIGTGNMVGSFYHEIWTQARKGENGFHATFLRWSLRPGRTEEWYTQAKASYPNKQEFARQYPNDEVEAFIAAGGCPFSIDDINWYVETHIKDPLPAEALSRNSWSDKLRDAALASELHVFEEPKTGFPYLVTFDPATGIGDNGDYHAIHVLKTLGEPEQVVEYRSRAHLDIACQIALDLAHLYNMCELVWERTGIGQAVTNIFFRSNYDFLYEHEEFEQERQSRHLTARQRESRIKKLGWPSSRGANAMRDNELIAVIREHSVIIHSLRWFDEAKGFVLQPDGTYAATGRAHDDLITSMGMGIWTAFRRMNKRAIPRRPTRFAKKRSFKREQWR